MSAQRELELCAEHYYNYNNNNTDYLIETTFHRDTTATHARMPSARAQGVPGPPRCGRGPRGAEAPPRCGAVLQGWARSLMGAALGSDSSEESRVSLDHLHSGWHSTGGGGGDARGGGGGGLSPGSFESVRRVRANF